MIFEDFNDIHLVSGVLKVASEVNEGVPFPSVPLQADIPDLSTPHYFFGGLSPGFEAPIVLPESFLGCMSDLQVIQEAYNPLRGHFWNVHKSCSDKVSKSRNIRGLNVLFYFKFFLLRLVPDTRRLQRKRVHRIAILPT